jgi:hypothetical protein
MVIRVDIFDGDDLVDGCTGPDADGSCPRADTQGEIACAGKVLHAAVAEAHWVARIPVGEHAHKCPLRGFVVEDPDRHRWS